jgi:hypothetical protein
MEVLLDHKIVESLVLCVITAGIVAPVAGFAEALRRSRFKWRNLPKTYRRIMSGYLALAVFLIFGPIAIARDVPMQLLAILAVAGPAFAAWGFLAGKTASGANRR